MGWTTLSRTDGPGTVLKRNHHLLYQSSILNGFKSLNFFDNFLSSDLVLDCEQISLMCWQQFSNTIRVSICTALNLSEFLNSSTTTSICFLDLFVVSDEQVKEIYKINKHYNMVLQINRFKSSFSLSRLSSFSFIIISRSSKLFTCAASLGLVATLSSSKAKLSSQLRVLLCSR